MYTIPPCKRQAPSGNKKIENELGAGWRTIVQIGYAVENIVVNPTTIHKVQAPMQPIFVSDERDKPDGSSSVSMKQAL
jgi:hypothetical protein